MTPNFKSPTKVDTTSQRQLLNVHILQHSPDTPPGTVLEWLEVRDHAFTVHKLYQGDTLPDLANTDWVIVLGGPMNADDIANYPWLKDEKKFLNLAVLSRKPCLGLCLGGQLLSQVLGGKVQKNSHWEAGWFPVSIEGHGELMVFQFHEDTFSIPDGAKIFATNSITSNQMFKFGEHVVGIQFHPETTSHWVDSFLHESPYPTGPYVQQPQELIAGKHHIQPMRNWFFKLLDHMELVALNSRMLPK